ncbi:hypothetical protein BJY01DRAFT_120948 [Aspergillus pseudoustus]|uniref:Uncharacterized protein n=1 Tax=Aspergillus pseudoustus TaxID=1810923 RepID=A0ABR4IQU8_9EURO
MQQYARNFSSDRTICGESCPLGFTGGALVNLCQEKIAQITWLSEVAVRLKRRAVCTSKPCSFLAPVDVLVIPVNIKTRLAQRASFDKEVQIRRSEARKRVFEGVGFNGSGLRTWREEVGESLTVPELNCANWNREFCFLTSFLQVTSYHHPFFAGFNRIASTSLRLYLLHRQNTERSCRYR